MKIGLFLCGLALPLVAQSGEWLAPASVPADSRFAALPASAAETFQFPSTKHDRVEGKAFYRWSQVAVFAGNAADTVSSWNQSEGNPLLAKSGGNFGTGSLAIKAGLLGTSLVIQRWALHHNPKLYKSFAWMNVAIAGGLGAAAAHNVAIR